MSKRFHVTVPDGVAEKLEKWAEIEGDKPTTLASFLLTKAVREAVEKGLIPDDSAKNSATTEPDRNER